MIRRQELLAALDGLLGDEPADYCPNGLQVEGTEEIERIVTGVSSCVELFAAARKKKAQAVLVHHGIFWAGQSPRLTGFQRQRVAEILAGDLNLFAYHLPLDRHPELGNNAVAAREFGLQHRGRFADWKGTPIGFHGRLPSADSIEEFTARTERVFGQLPLRLGNGPEKISSVGIVSGAAEDALHEAIDLGLDAFLTGEASEWVMNVAREAGIHFLACGHYATERLGILALGDHLAESLPVEVDFVDVPNPV